jgi:hypothetical protein
MNVTVVTWRRRAAWVALFGLLMQIALTFTHVHPIAVQFDACGSVIAADFGGAPSPQNSPSAPGSDRCFVCLAQHLTGHGVLPDLAVLAIPEAANGAYRGRDNKADVSRPEHLLFHIRAPPVA